MKPKTTPASAIPTLEATAEPPKRPRGRPPGLSSPKTGAERQRAYLDRQKAERDRQKAAVQTAIGDPYDKPTPVVLASLGNLLGQLDDPARADDHATLRSLAGLAMRELASRYGIEPFTSK